MTEFLRKRSLFALAEPRHLRWILPLVLGLCIVRLWLTPLPSSFWVDEMGTAFVVRYGGDHPSLQVAPQVPASVYYALPKLMHQWFGLSEVAYRLPSTLAMCVAMFFIVRLGNYILYPSAGWFIAFISLGIRGFNYQAADARPYGLGSAVFFAALWCLVRWFDTARWRYAVPFTAAALLLWRVQLVFWPLYILFAGYALVRLVRRDTALSLRSIVLVFLVIGVGLIPVLMQAIELNREAGAHVFVPLPSIGTLGRELRVGLVLGLGTVAALLARWLRWDRIEWVPAVRTVAFVLLLWLCHPLCLFAYSLITGNSVFVSRYMFITLPGVGFAAAGIVGGFLPARFWRPAALAVGVVVLLILGRWNHLAIEHHNSNWRLASQKLNEQVKSPDAPVLCPSPFIEAQPPVWRPDYPLESWMYSQLLIYPPSGRKYPFPFKRSPEAEDAAGKLARGTLAQSNQFFLYGGDYAVLSWSEWLSARPELTGWRWRRLGPFGDVEVVVFQNPAAR